MKVSELERIVIYSHWLGFAEPPTQVSKLEVVFSSGTPVVVDPPSLKAVECKLEDVSRFLVLLAEKPLPLPDPKQHGGNPKEIEEHYFHSGWEDDNPRIRIKVISKSGNQILLTSESQKAHMLPWMISTVASEIGIRTYDQRLSLALGALLPPGFTNQRRLFSTLIPSEADQQAAAEMEATRIQGELEAEKARNLLSDDDKGLLASAWPPFNRNLFDAFVRKGANVNVIRPEDGASGVCLAAAGGDLEPVKAWLESGADVNIPARDGSTALMNGVSWPEIVALLLKAGADVNARDKDESTPLMYAVVGRSWSREARKIEIVKMLLAAGADPCVRDNLGKTALTYALEQAERSRLEKEIQQEFHPDVAVLDTDFESSVDAEGRDSVVYFKRTDGTELCQLLEESGAKP